LSNTLFDWFNEDSSDMYGKCRILAFKITVFQVMGLCNLIGEYRIFSQDMLFPSFNDLWRHPECLSKTIKTMHLSWTTLWILTTSSTSNLAPTNIKNNWRMDGNVTLGKLNYRRAVCFLQKQYLKSHTFFFFPSIVYMVFHILPLIISINTHFTVRTIYDEFRSYTKMIPNESHTPKTTFNVDSPITKYRILKSTMHSIK